jgi:predicted HAD superfamily phosphohydrolase YqeG
VALSVAESPRAKAESSSSVLIPVSEIELSHSPVRKWFGYARALLELSLGKSQHWVTHIEHHDDLEGWEPFRSVHLFFDIDDTLNVHRKGLTEKICCWLDDHVTRGKTVVLLTNCSEKRAQEHRERLLQYGCRAELWPVGGKPDVTWLLSCIHERSWSPSDCAMVGDRPTMDMWLAMKAGFSERIWVKSWGARRCYQHPLTWIQGLEWRLLR